MITAGIINDEHTAMLNFIINKYTKN